MPARPLGAYSVLGNHDWDHGPLPDMAADDAEGVRRALRSANIEVLENHAVRVTKDGRPFWIAGLGDQLEGFAGPAGFTTRDDLDATLGQVKDKSPVILLAHSVTLCGHTHGHLEK
jgi:predicted MPP superfamily phosphohydrolase